MRTVNIVFKSLYACAHRCGFCHVLHVPRNLSYMSTAQVKQTFDQIERLFAGHRVEMELSGGEFTLRHDAVELVAYLRTKNIRWSSLVLDTMGVPLADEELARALGALFDKVNVSVHACDAALHATISSSRTRFEDLAAALRNLFRFFPAVFTNTSINRHNGRRLGDIARFVLDCRAAAPRTPLYCLYYLPVFREYGEATKENAFRLQGADNAQFLPPAPELPAVRDEFRAARALLAAHGAAALLRDFNMPACVYEAVTGDFPDGSFGLPNFMTDCYFTDYAHPITERHGLEQVYPSMDDRVQTESCGGCVAQAVCRGVPRQWLQRGYAPRPIDERAYASRFPGQLLNQTLFGIFHDAVRARALLASLHLDWDRLARSYLERLAGGAVDIREIRARVAGMTLAERVDALTLHLRGEPNRAATVLCRALERERGQLASPSGAHDVLSSQTNAALH